MNYFIDNLENVANRLYQFLTLPANKEHIYHIIEDVKKNYEASWVSMTRHRNEALGQLLLSVNTKNFLPTLVAFFRDENGGWKTTSANTNLVYQLVRVLPDFTPERDDAFFNPQHIGAAFYMECFNAHHKRVIELFIDQYERVKKDACAPSASHDHLQAEQIQRRRDELEGIKKSRFPGMNAEIAKSLFESTIFKKKNTLATPNKLKANPQFAKAMNAVQGIFSDNAKMKAPLPSTDDLTKSTIFHDASSLMDATLFEDQAPSVALKGLFAARRQAKDLPAVVLASHERQKVG